MGILEPSEIVVRVDHVTQKIGFRQIFCCFDGSREISLYNSKNGFIGMLSEKIVLPSRRGNDSMDTVERYQILSSTNNNRTN